MTTKLPPEHYLPIWESAQEQEIGIEVLCPPEDQMKLVNALYECRNVCGGFEGLMIFQPKPEGTLFIAHKSAELPDA